MVIVSAFSAVYLLKNPLTIKGEETQISDAPSVYAQAAVLMDGENGRVLYGKNEEQILPMASTTKIMTCIVALEQAEPDEIVEVSEYAASMPDVQLNMKEGESYHLKDLLYSLMLESHNDSAVAIAEHVAGSQAAFADLMNQKARDLGCIHTHFVTPNGLDAVDEESGAFHGTTAEELAKIMRYCVFQSPKRDEFLEITRAPSYAFSDLDRTRSFSCINHNTLLTSMEGAMSGKTGFTNKAGYCYVGAVERGEKQFICALLACGWPPNKSYKWQDMRKLITFGDEQYDFYDLGRGSVEIRDIPVENGIIDFVKIEVVDDDVKEEGEDVVARVLMRPDESITVRKMIKKNIQAPVTKGMCVGQMEYRLGDIMIACIPIITAEEVEEWNPEFCLKTLLNRYLFCYNAD